MSSCQLVRSRRPPRPAGHRRDARPRRPPPLGGDPPAPPSPPRGRRLRTAGAAALRALGDRLRRPRHARRARPAPSRCVRRRSRGSSTNSRPPASSTASPIPSTGASSRVEATAEGRQAPPRRPPPPRRLARRLPSRASGKGTLGAREGGSDSGKGGSRRLAAPRRADFAFGTFALRHLRSSAFAVGPLAPHAA